MPYPVSYKDALVQGVAKGAKKGARFAQQGKAGKAPDAAEADNADDEEKELRQLEAWLAFAVAKSGDGPLLDAVRRDIHNKKEAVAARLGGACPFR